MRNFLLSVFTFLIGGWMLPVQATLFVSNNTSMEEGFSSNRVVQGCIFKSGVYSFPFVQGTSPTKLTTVVNDPDLSVMDGVIIDGKYYASIMFQVKTEGSGLQYYLRIYDPVTWEELGRVDDFVNASQGIGNLAYDITEDQMYGISRSPWELVKIDYKTGVCRKIAAFDFNPLAITFNNKGQLYMIGNDRNLYKVDKSTGEATLIGSLDLNFTTTVYSSFMCDEYSGKLYFSAYLGYNSGLYEINTETGKAERVIIFPEMEIFNGLFISDVVNDEAPAAVSAVEFIPNALGSLTGKVSFTPPTTTQGGEELTGALSGILYAGPDVQIELSNLLPGVKYDSELITLTNSGYNSFRISLSNDAGQSVRTPHWIWVGKDRPATVTGLTLEKDTDRKAVIRWNAVTTGAHGAYLESSQVRYKIIRFPDNVQVADNLSTTSFVDDSFEEVITAYYYEVIPYWEEMIGNESQTNTLAFGLPYIPPFVADISEEGFKVWSTLNLNNDVNTWLYHHSGDYNSPQIHTNSADDWLFSPAIQLEGGAIYRLKYNMSGLNIKMRVTYGTSPTPAVQNELKVHEGFTNKNGEDFEHLIYIPANEGGVYYIGFYSYSEADRTGSTTVAGLKNITLELAANPGSPNVVTNFSIVYGNQGAAPATISFVAPVLTTSNDQLNEISEINIYRNEEEAAVYTIRNTEPGKNYNWIDNDVSEGINYYRIVASNSEGEGLAIVESIYIGWDSPDAVRNLTLTKNEAGKAILNWEAPEKGINNGYLGNYVYMIERNGELLTESWNTTRYVDETITDNQHIYTYTVTPIYTNDREKDGVASTSEAVRFGSAYLAPFAESFSNSSYDNSGWSTQILSGEREAWGLNSTLSMTTFKPQDDDKGMAVCYFENLPAHSKVRLLSPILDFSTVEEPILRFWLTHYELPNTYGEHLLISISTNGGETFETLEMDTIYLQRLANKNLHLMNDWNFYEFSLEKYKGEKEVIIGFDGGLHYNFGFNMGLDNITIVDRPAKDLKLNYFVIPSRLFAGYNNEFEVYIKNSGKETADNYTVKVYKKNAKTGKNEIITSKQGVSIKSDESYTFLIPVSFNIDEIGQIYELYAEVEYEGDELELDNISYSLEAMIERSIYSAPLDLEFALESEGVILEWYEPVISKEPVIVEDSFEDYPVFAIEDIGDWKLVDGDKEPTLTFGLDVFNILYKNSGEPMAYQVFDAMLSGASLQIPYSWEARTGSQALVTFLSSTYYKNDDWLISPELTGASQEVVFYARNVNTAANAVRERFVFCYSLTGNEVEDFVNISDREYVETIGSWTEYRYTLPEGTRYFAIHCVSQNSVSFIVDDISFVKAGEQALTVKGYNIYRNDVKLNDELYTSLVYEKAPVIDGERNVYTVTAVYENGGESNYSNVQILDYSGIEDNVSSSIYVYSVPEGILVEGCEGNLIEIYTIDGNSIYRVVGQGNDRIKLSAGIYLVKVGNKINKAVVR